MYQRNELQKQLDQLKKQYILSEKRYVQERAQNKSNKESFKESKCKSDQIIKSAEALTKLLKTSEQLRKEYSKALS